MPTTSVHDLDAEMQEIDQTTKWAQHELKGIVADMVDCAFATAKNSYKAELDSGIPRTLRLSREQYKALKSIRTAFVCTKRQMRRLLQCEIELYAKEHHNTRLQCRSVRRRKVRVIKQG